MQKEERNHAKQAKENTGAKKDKSQEEQNKGKQRKHYQNCPKRTSRRTVKDKIKKKKNKDKKQKQSQERDMR
jgi:hypothetical protein